MPTLSRGTRLLWAAPRGLVAAWRRSIQARVVMSTLVLSAAVVALVGVMLLRQVAGGLVDTKRDASLAEAAAGFSSAQQQLNASDSTSPDDSGKLLTELVENLSSRGGSGLYEVVLAGPISGPSGPVHSRGSRTTPAIDPVSIPQSLRERVERSPGTYWAYSRLRFRPVAHEAPTPGIVVGSQLRLPANGATYTLYYLFPMSEQAATLSLVERALISAGLVLIALVGGVAWLVTRQVVSPVRLARRIAERLAAGRLEERMHVKGEDDIARLGMSFNQMAHSLQRQIRQLEELSRVQRRFVSDVSHELRTPLTTVRMAADVLHESRASFDPVTARSAELLQAELDRFEALLSDLLEISRFDAGAAVLETDEVDLVEVADRTVEATRPLAERRGTTIELQAADRPCLAEVDVRRVERILRNLLSNAIEYGGPGEVVVAVATDGVVTALTVRDHGPGLAPGEAAMVFNRFWRADPARARGVGGTGLGLAIALEDAHLHGGWLQAWGAPGLGAQFRLTLPRRVGDRLGHSPLPLVPADAGSGVGAAYARLDEGVSPATTPRSGR